MFPPTVFLPADMNGTKKHFLTFDFITRNTQQLTIPPYRPLPSLLVPSICLSDTTCRSTSVSVRDTDGFLSVPWTCENACEKSQILVSYISHVKGLHSVDLDHIESVLVSIDDQSFPSCVDLFATKPYPDQDLNQGKIVVLSGSICSSSPRCDLFILSPELRPACDLHVLCSPDGHYVEVSGSSGQVTLVSPLATLLLPVAVSLDNVKFFVSENNLRREKDVSVLSLVRPGLPNRPNLLVLDPTRNNEVNSLLLMPKDGTFRNPILIPCETFDRSSKTCKMTVACMHFGGMEMLGSPASQFVIFPDSLITATPRKNSDILCTMFDCPLDETSKRRLTDLVISKLPAVVYSRLSGEPELKALAKAVSRPT